MVLLGHRADGQVSPGDLPICLSELNSQLRAIRSHINTLAGTVKTGWVVCWLNVNNLHISEAHKPDIPKQARGIQEITALNGVEKCLFSLKKSELGLNRQGFPRKSRERHSLPFHSLFNSMTGFL